MSEWGIYDVQDRVWYGGDEGPRIFDDEMLARCALTILHAQLPQAFTIRTDGQASPRLQVLGWIGGGSMHIHSTVKPKMTALQALKGVERGTLV